MLVFPRMGPSSWTRTILVALAWLVLTPATMIIVGFFTLPEPVVPFPPFPPSAEEWAWVQDWRNRHFALQCRPHESERTRSIGQ